MVGRVDRDDLAQLAVVDGCFQQAHRVGVADGKRRLQDDAGFLCGLDHRPGVGTLTEMGFSHKTCLPAWAAAIVVLFVIGVGRADDHGVDILRQKLLVVAVIRGALNCSAAA